MCVCACVRGGVRVYVCECVLRSVLRVGVSVLLSALCVYCVCVLCVYQFQLSKSPNS